MDGQEFYELFVRFVREHELRGVVFGPGPIPGWDELRDRSKALWQDIATGLEPRSDTINDRLAKTVRAA